MRLALLIISFCVYVLSAAANLVAFFDDQHLSNLNVAMVFPVLREVKAA